MFPKKFMGRRVVGIMQDCTLSSNAINSCTLSFPVKLSHTPAFTVFYERKIVTIQHHIQLHIKVISEMLKRNEENCRINILKTGTDYTDK